MSMAGLAPKLVEPLGPPMQVDAFQNALNAAGAAIFANPDAMGAALMQGLDGFRSQEAHFQDAISQAMSTQSADVPDKGMTTAEVIQKSDAQERKSLGLMMETYSFSLEATLVTNAATTFTSSINTLVKTQ